MIVPPVIADHLSPLVGKILSVQSVSGGCINSCASIKTPEGKFFLKWNNAGRFPGMLMLEEKGLRLLSTTNGLRIPRPLMTAELDDYQYLLLEEITPAKKADNYWEIFASGLASLHRASWNYYGLDHDNYIGSLPQRNRPETDWTRFFIEQRLEPMLALAASKGLVDTGLRRSFDKMYLVLEDLLLSGKPSLLHGDLWSGNLMTDENGRPCIIDPAVYFGNREVDLAMTTLFGGFNQRFLKIYHEAFPLDRGYEDRFRIYNLYPLLVHVNLFGASYLSQVSAIIRSFK